MYHTWNEVSEDTIAPNGNTVKENHIITKVFSLFSDSVGVYRNWMFYMIDKEFDKEQKLRNKIGTIILGSLFDIVSYENKIDEFKREALSNNLDFLESYFNVIEDYISSVKSFMSIFTKEEQLLITHLRDQFVYSHLSGRLNIDKKVKYIENGILIKEKIKVKELNKIIESFLNRRRVDDILEEFIGRWWDNNSKYTSYILGFIKHEKEIYDSIYKKVPIQISFF